MNLYALIFAVSLVRVYARAAQQLNVVQFRWKRIAPFSYLMSLADVVLWGTTAHYVVSRNWLGAGLSMFLYGTAGWIGAMLAMKFHPRANHEQ